MLPVSSSSLITSSNAIADSLLTSALVWKTLSQNVPLLCSQFLLGSVCACLYPVPLIASVLENAFCFGSCFHHSPSFRLFRPPECTRAPISKFFTRVCPWGPTLGTLHCYHPLLSIIRPFLADFYIYALFVCSVSSRPNLSLFLFVLI